MGMRAKEILAKVGHHCTASKNNLAAAKAQIAKHTNAVHKALNVAKKICKKEKEMARRSAEKKKKHEARGATFKFDNRKPCKGGKGDFRMKLKQDQRVVVGKIPANMKDVWVKLRTDKDVDTELWTADGKREIAIVAWRVGKIDSPSAASIKYAGGTIKYSGYNGIASKNGALNFGHEDIEIVGKSKSAFTMKAFAFESGTAKVYYSWGADPVKCKAQKAKRRQEKKKKHNAKVALKKRLSEKDYKKALKAAASVAQNCSGANNYTKAMKVALKAAIQLVEGHKIKLKKCHTNKEKYSKHLHQLDAKEKKYKEGDAKESAMKKERAIKKEKMNKERAQKYAKEQKSKESKAKEGAHKVEQAAKEKHAKEKNAKERNGKERAKKREHKNKEAAAKAKERHDKAVKKERKAKADGRRSKELSSKERTSKERTSKERTNKAERAKKESASKEQSQKKERASKERAKKESAGKESTNKERAGKAERSHKERSYKQERTNKERSSKQYRARNTCTVWAYEHNNYQGRVMRHHSYCGPGRQDVRFHRMYRRRRGFHASSFKLSSGCRQAQLWDEDNCRYGYGDNMNIRSSTGSVTWDLNDDICGMSIWSTAGHNC